MWYVKLSKFKIGHCEQKFYTQFNIVSYGKLAEMISNDPGTLLHFILNKYSRIFAEWYIFQDQSVK